MPPSAAGAYDEVLAIRLEDVPQAAALSGRFDAILFGDVLEHLADPSDALVRVRPWLSERGVVVASVPNVGHWSIVDDLIRGRFDYVPYSILSGTHVRFFTRSTLIDLFEASGYRVAEIDTQMLPASPDGAKRARPAREVPGRQRRSRRLRSSSPSRSRDRSDSERSLAADRRTGVLGGPSPDSSTLNLNFPSVIIVAAMMNKVVSSADEAVRDVPDGATARRRRIRPLRHPGEPDRRARPPGREGPDRRLEQLRRR